MEYLHQANQKQMLSEYAPHPVVVELLLRSMDLNVKLSPNFFILYKHLTD